MTLDNLSAKLGRCHEILLVQREKVAGSEFQALRNSKTVRLLSDFSPAEKYGLSHF
jgi:hypothetical protein